MKKCQSCGAELEDDAAFCISCEDELPGQSTGNSNTDGETLCSACKHPLRAGALFCVSCGAKVAEAAGETKSDKKSKIGKGLGIKGKQGKKQPAAEKSIAADQPEPEEKRSPVDEPQTKKPLPGISGKPKNTLVENWDSSDGENIAQEADDLDVLQFGSGIVSKVILDDTFSANELLIKGKLKCLGCDRITIFSLESIRGWGGSNDPLTCPCGKDIEIGDYWDGQEDAVYIWASSGTMEKKYSKYPLSLTITKLFIA